LVWVGLLVVWVVVLWVLVVVVWGGGVVVVVGVGGGVVGFLQKVDINRYRSLIERLGLRR
jgi:hypothetical protein